jgi:hypothetical protein
MERSTSPKLARNRLITKVTDIRRAKFRLAAIWVQFLCVTRSVLERTGNCAAAVAVAGEKKTINLHLLAIKLTFTVVVACAFF